MVTVSALSPRYKQTPLVITKELSVSPRTNDDNITVVAPNVGMNFVSSGLTTTIVIPSQAVTESIALTYTSRTSPSLAIPAGSHFVNRAFRFNVYQSGVLITEFDFIQPLTVTLVYSDEAFAAANAVHQASRFTLYFFGFVASIHLAFVIFTKSTTNNSKLPPR